jgi:hypothetical protein
MSGALMPPDPLTAAALQAVLTVRETASTNNLVC